MPYALYSDLYDHREFVRALCNSGFSGLLWSPEIRSAANAEEWARRMQVVCLSPLAMLNAWADSLPPWAFPAADAAVRRAIELRMRLLPYIYSAFARYHFDGTPPIRTMALEPGACAPDGACAFANVDDQFMLGDSMLVAPLFAGQKSRTVHLPPGAWHDFDSGERFEGTIEVTAEMERIPIFVRSGAIVPLGPPLQHAPTIGQRLDIEARHYGATPGTFALYDDDGETFDFERGEFQWRTLTVKLDAKGQRTGSISAPAAGKPDTVGNVTWRFLG
jgi:alpha-D-xyloside xylohydrolase